MQNKLATIAMIMIAMIGMTGFAAATTVSIGDVAGTGEVTTPITVEDVTDLGMCSVKLTFDETLVSVTGVTVGDMDSMTTSDFGINDGHVVIKAFYSNPTPGTDVDVIVAYVTFTPLEPCWTGSCGLSLTNTVVLADVSVEGEAPIDHNTRDGTYTATLVKGDASGNGEVTDYDVLYIARYAMSTPGWLIGCPAMADVNGVEGVTTDDARYLANHLIDPGSYPLL